jgi:spermidine synthase
LATPLHLQGTCAPSVHVRARRSTECGGIDDSMFPSRRWPKDITGAGTGNLHPVGSVSGRAVATNSRRRAHWIHLIVLGTGFSGLAYEIVWTRMLAVSLGHEIIAVLAVLAAFFAGLALGAFTLSNALRRTQFPHRWYALLEVLIGLWGIALVRIIPVFNQLIPRWIGEEPSGPAHRGIAFGATLLVLLPGTAAMGATLPALERVYGKLFGVGRYVGGVYSANTFGAVAGTILAALLLVPALGYARTLLACAVVSFVCAGGMIWLISRVSGSTETTETAGSGTLPCVMSFPRRELAR